MAPRTDITAGSRISRAVTAPWESGPPLSVMEAGGAIEERRPGRVRRLGHKDGAFGEAGEVLGHADLKAGTGDAAGAAGQTAKCPLRPSLHLRLPLVQRPGRRTISAFFVGMLRFINLAALCSTILVRKRSHHGLQIGHPKEEHIVGAIEDAALL